MSRRPGMTPWTETRRRIELRRGYDRTGECSRSVQKNADGITPSTCSGISDPSRPRPALTLVHHLWHVSAHRNLVAEELVVVDAAPVSQTGPPPRPAWFDTLVTEVDQAFEVTSTDTPGWPDPHPDRNPADGEVLAVPESGQVSDP
jgi:hypothetical protein